jgi:hypothetical protein
MTHHTRPPHRSEWIDVTQEIAERWLDTRAPNRRLNENRVMEYALIMEAGGWQETHQGIGFDTKGRLCDGQHRLKALSLQKSGTRIKFLVTRGLTEAEVLAVDHGGIRDAADSLTIFRGVRVEKHEVAVAKRVMHISGHYAAKVGRTPGSSWSIPTTALDAFLRLHPAAMLMAASLRHRCHTRGITSAMLGGLIFRAYYHLPSKRLDVLLDVLATGHYDDKDADSAGLVLREHVMTGSEGYRGTNLLDHFRMERAIKAFWKGEKLAKIYPATEELFPLPEERTDTATKVPAVVRRMEATRAAKAAIGGKATQGKLAIANGAIAN